MRRTVIRQLSIGAVVAVVAAAFSSAAFAAHHGRFGAVHGFRAQGFMAQAGGMMGGPGGPGGFMIGGFGGPGGGGFRIGFGPGGPGGPGGGGGALGADVLTPAAACLGISMSTLTSDLNGGATLAKEATGKGPSACNTSDELIAALVKAQTTNLDNEKAAGWITADQETALLAGYTKHVTSLVNDGPPVPSTERPGGLLDAASTYLGISVSDLQADLKAGKTLASLVVAPKTVDGLVTAIEAPVKKHLDDAVTANTITQAQETAILGKMTAGLTDLVNGKAGSHELNTVRHNVKLFAVKHFGAKK